MVAKAWPAPTTAQPRTSKLGRVLRKLREQRILFLFMLPGALTLLAFNYLPMTGIVMAFEDFKAQSGLLGSQFVGLKHFATFLKDPAFFNALRNTLTISLLSIGFGFPLPIVLALMIDAVRSSVGQRTIQSITYLPHFINWVVLASLVYRLLDRESGIVNLAIMQFGGEPIAFMRHPEYFWQILVSAGIWKEIGWNSIIYLAAIMSIDPELHEAARVDGASLLGRMRYVTLPGILPTIGLMFVLTLGSLVVVNFEAVFNMMNAFVQTRADVIDTFVYRTGVQQGRYSYATAIGLTQSVISAALVLIGFRLTRRVNGYTV